ncbi:photosystem II PsbZ, reaction centre [Artemisia annua]|uniref:Photosystem II reaction center protein Z n=1 Tax=Artemisia annua TaxID=35608 RepID=A0A2U1LCG6_ARTAN|nr:photosystem II PsbZ, reaction centre [Artemisia annua]
MTLAFQLAVFALIATSSILLIGVPVVFASPDGWSSPEFLTRRKQTKILTLRNSYSIKLTRRLLTHRNCYSKVPYSKVTYSLERLTRRKQSKLTRRKNSLLAEKLSLLTRYFLLASTNPY